MIGRGFLTVLAVASPCSAALDGSRYLWFTQPSRWQTFEDGMPIGNGRVAAMIYGGGTEVLGINENSIWTGPFQDRLGVNASRTEPIVRQELLDGKFTEARLLTMDQMIPTNFSPRSFSYFGNINIAFGHEELDIENYMRWLDTKEGTAGVNYTYQGTKYSREYVASYPHGILAARFQADKAGKLNMNITMTRQNNVKSTTAIVSKDNSTVTLVGTSGQSDSEDPILWTGQARFVSKDGTVTTSGSSLIFTNSTMVEMYFDTETNYRYSTQVEWEAEMRRKIDAAHDVGYDKVKEAAIADTTNLLGRVTLDLGESPNGLEDLPTDQRIAHARNTTEDLQLSTLVFNYGRHLLVASSRNTGDGKSLPANLQGIWNNSTSAPWGGKYTININTNMNYWPAGPTNLIESEQPLLDLIAVARVRGQSMAQRMYGCPGTVFHHNLDMWGDPAPTDNYTASTMWPVGAAWLSWHVMDHYRFTGDKDYLREIAYPFFVDLASFYECYTFEYQGHRVTGPSLSPENSFYVPDSCSIAGNIESIDIAPAMDSQLLVEVFSSLVESAEILGIDNSDVSAAKEFLPKIFPPQIGSLGQILEWRSEYKEKAAGHKHLSPLWALMPGRQFSPLLNSTLGKAAEVLLDRRVEHGSGGTGWSRVWLINQLARVFRGDDAWGHLTQWFAVFVTPFNLFNTDAGDPYKFQIDGNFGFVNGIAEMLLQSHAGVVHLLPALPSASPTGSVKGLVARGNFLVDIAWADGRMTKATITSRIGGDLALRYMNGLRIIVNGKAYSKPITTTAGSVYVVKPGCSSRSSS